MGPEVLGELLGSAETPAQQRGFEQESSSILGP